MLTNPSLSPSFVDLVTHTDPEGVVVEVRLDLLVGHPHPRLVQPPSHEQAGPPGQGEGGRLVGQGGVEAVAGDLRELVGAVTCKDMS